MIYKVVRFFDENAKLLENAKFICYNELKLNIDK